MILSVPVTEADSFRLPAPGNLGVPRALSSLPEHSFFLVQNVPSTQMGLSQVCCVLCVVTYYHVKMCIFAISLLHLDLQLNK